MSVVVLCRAKPTSSFIAGGAVPILDVGQPVTYMLALACLALRMEALYSTMTLNCYLRVANTHPRTIV